MKTHILMVSRTFPAYHPRKGQLTDFPKNIIEAVCGLKIPPAKLHTIRSNYELWKKRIDEVHAGTAVLSVRFWSDKPYRSKQLEIVRFEKGDKIGIQKLDNAINFTGATINKKLIGWGDIAKNDGLSFNDFCSWFEKNYSNTLAIIHFTDFRY